MLNILTLKNFSHFSIFFQYEFENHCVLTDNFEVFDGRQFLAQTGFL